MDGVDPLSIIFGLSGPLSTASAILLMLTGRLGKLEGKDKVTITEIKDIRAYANDTRKMVNNSEDELKNVYKEMNELKSKQNLLEYIAGETKDLVEDIQNRVSSIDKALTRLTYYRTDREGKSPV